ncbi:MAG: hypothetical protein LC798_21415 [Chloroflexi bacterium]|nr:hypothetical protein [Chloroflexota bacterium]
MVLDGGTLEHVFDYPTALRGALDAVRLGGHFIAVTPANGWCGHAQRVQQLDLTNLRLQQPDYTTAWRREHVGSPASSRLRHYVPHPLQEPLVELRSTLRSLTRFAAVCSDFQAVRLDRLGEA